jgi:hypothetical protein
MPTNQNPLAALLANNLRVGAVIYKFCDFTTPPKNKFMVVASLEPNLLVLMVNSEINTFYVQRGLQHLHVPVPVADHDFLSHDSYTNCVDVHTAFDCNQIKQEVINDYVNVFKGWLTDDCLESVYHAVKSTNLLRKGHQKEIIASIESHLPHLHSAY